jgi:hypothetical protein|tara:strand:- start:333 stop:467 length:135 start_codon:yes stop_codon:yes gene_type:complete
MIIGLAAGGKSGRTRELTVTFAERLPYIFRISQRQKTTQIKVWK